jgi:hypothetical protein
MKKLMALIAFLPTLAFANLGDTREQSNSRYGEPIPIEHTSLVFYYTPDWLIMEWFNKKEIVESITYYRRDGLEITQMQMDGYCTENNAVISHWTKNPIPESPPGVQVVGIWVSVINNLRLESDWIARSKDLSNGSRSVHSQDILV